ncbi:peptidase C39, partial [Paraburkholderia sp. BR14261]
MSGPVSTPASRMFVVALTLSASAALVPVHAQQSTLDATHLVGVPVKLPLHSMRDLRYRSIVSQQYDYSCGAAALATLLKYGYGI